MMVLPTAMPKTQKSQYGSVPAFAGSNIRDAPDHREQGYARSKVNQGLGFIGFLLFVAAVATVNHHSGYLAGSTLSSNAQLLSSPSVSSHNEEKSEGETEHFYKDQLVDHFKKKNKNTYTQRYYKSEKYFKGPGHPIFLIIGGEDDAVDLLYPYVYDKLASHFKAFVLHPEHRFYGKSLPVEVKKNTDFIGLLTVEQAMEDILQILNHIQKNLGCSMDKHSKHYCPVITVGGSYPGFLSALLRMVHPDQIDIAYASSAPLKTYSQEMDPDAYFELVTRTADQASPGCSTAVRDTLEEVHASILVSNSCLEEAKRMHICLDDIPDYIDSKEIFAQEVTLIVGENFADFNMGFYPPDASSNMAKACVIFQDDSLDLYEKMDEIFQLIAESNYFETKKCGFDMRTQLPDGDNARISTSDWTGSGPGLNGMAWEFQMCTELIVRTSFSEKSMFYPREWTLERQTDYCQSRFGVGHNRSTLLTSFTSTTLAQRLAYCLRTG